MNAAIVAPHAVVIGQHLRFPRQILRPRELFASIPSLLLRKNLLSVIMSLSHCHI